MFVDYEVFIGLRDIGVNNKVTNTAILSYFEDAGGLHSNKAGYGLLDIPIKKKSWVLFQYHIKFLERPCYGQKITIRTWARGLDKIHAYRDFEVLNDQGEVIGKATSIWILIDIEKLKITKLRSRNRK